MAKRSTTEHGYFVPPYSWCKQFNAHADRWLCEHGESNLSFGEHIKRDADLDRVKRESKGGSK